MVPKNVVDDRAVYVAFNSIFQGQDSQIRKLSPIKKLVHKHQKQPQVAQLLKEYGAPVIYEKLQRLLSGQIFESTLKAKCEFPQLFEVSRTQSAERAISEAEAAAGHAKAVEEALDSADRYGLPYKSDSDSERTCTNPQVKASIGLPTEQQSACLGIRVPSLFPLEFNFTTAYKILVKTQKVLELACFRFAEKAMPEILEKRKWHCPESAELNLWATEFLKRLVWFEKRPSRAFSPSRPLKELFLSIAQIRHHAVHRIPVTAKELEGFMADGETIVQLFEDHTAIAVMSRARSEVHKAAVEMENRKNMLEARLTEVLQNVADKRAELDRVEAEAIADTQRKDKENQLFANAHLQEAIWLDDGAVGEGFLATQSPAASGVDNDSVWDELDTALESDMASYEDTKIDDAMKAGPMPSALGANFIGDSDGDCVAEEFEDAPTESLRPADADGDEVETEKREFLSNASEVIHGPEASELGWPHLFPTRCASYGIRMVMDMARRHIYAEIWPNFMDTNQVWTDDGKRRIDNVGIMEMIIPEVERFRRGNEDGDNCFVGLKVIYCCPQSYPTEKVASGLAECLRFKKRWPSWIAGFDLVGEEGMGKPLSACVLVRFFNCIKNFR